MRARSLASFLVAGLLCVSVVAGGCSRCGKPAVAVAVDASADASVEAAAPVDAKLGPDELALRPVAWSRARSSLHRLADGTAMFAHGAFVDRLLADGRRESVVRVTNTSIDVGTVAGTIDDFWVSDIWVDYPSTHGSNTWRVKDHDAKRDRLGGSNSFYLGIWPWKDGRLFGYRGNGAIASFSTMLPWTPEAFVVAKGAPTKLPKIPKDYFVEDVVAFPSGTVIAAATISKDGVMIAREGTIALRWPGGAEKALIEPIPENLEGLAQHIAARSEDDVWIGGGASSFMHWDGKAWSLVAATEVSDGVRSMAVSADGALWIVDGGHGLSRRDPNGTWTPIDIPTVHTDYAKPHITWHDDRIKVDRDRDIKLEAKAEQVVAAGNDVWVKAVTTEEWNTGAVLFHWSRAKEAPDMAVDVDEEDTRALDDNLTTPTKKECPLFVTGGPPTEVALNRVKAAPQTTIVVARVKGKPVIGAAWDPQSREGADEMATTWRGLGLPAEVLCGRPPVDSVVVESP